MLTRLDEYSGGYFALSVLTIMCLVGSILAKLSWKLKWAFLFARRPSVRLSVLLSVNFSHFYLLLQNHWTNYNQTWHKAFLGKGDSKLFRSFTIGNDYKIAKIYWLNLTIHSSRTTRQISTKLGTKHPWEKGIQVCSNEEPKNHSIITK